MMERGQEGLLARFGRRPEDIESRSLAVVEAQLDGLGAWPEGERVVVQRVVYASGDFAIAPLVRFHPDAIRAGIEALRRGATLVCDVRMVAAGLDRVRCDRLGCAVTCALDDPSAAEVSQQRGISRAAAAMELAAPHLDHGIAVIGNAPTALLAVLDLVDAGSIRPALVVGMPVGFVAARESKEELCSRGVPYITIQGTRGGSPLAAAAANAILRLALGEETASQGGDRVSFERQHPG